jgi:hypothetical protein
VTWPVRVARQRQIAAWPVDFPFRRLLQCAFAGEFVGTAPDQGQAARADPLDMDIGSVRDADAVGEISQQCIQRILRPLRLCLGKLVMGDIHRGDENGRFRPDALQRQVGDFPPDRGGALAVGDNLGFCLRLHRPDRIDEGKSVADAAAGKGARFAASHLLRRPVCIDDPKLRPGRDHGDSRRAIQDLAEQRCRDVAIPPRREDGSQTESRFVSAHYA